MDVFLTGFPKKLLVATSVVVIMTMCVIPAEARAVRLRHAHERRQELAHAGSHDARPRMHEPKAKMHDARPKMHGMRLDQRRAAQGKQTLTFEQSSKIQEPLRHQKNANAVRFKNATRKIIRKLKNTRRFFNDDRRVLNETKEFRDGMPNWLPPINFVNIHNFPYKTIRRPGASSTEKKFVYIMPKLYKSLVDYQQIFERLLLTEVELPDDPFCEYNRTRHGLITNILNKLFSTISEIKENMASVNMPIPQLTPNKNLTKMATRVNASQCLKNDYVAFRAYGNLLNNWYLEFRCPAGKKVINSNKKCAAFERTLKQKARSRKEKNKPIR